MKVRISTAVKMLALAAAMAAASSASAQSAGQWAVSVGALKITPKVESGDISAPALPHSQADVNANTQPVVTIDYMFTDNISAETSLAPPFKHKFTGAGAIAGIGEVGSSQALPATAFLQYRFFKPDAMIRPYVGLGITYAYFMKETGSGKMTAITNPGGAPTTFSVDNKLTYSLQAGLTVAVKERWFINAAVIKTKLATDVHFSTNQHQHIKLDPTAVSVGVGYKF